MNKINREAYVMSIHRQYFKTPIGEMVVASYDKQLCILDFKYRKMRQAVDNRVKKYLKTTFIDKSDAIIEETKHQLNEYLKGSRQQFDVPILMLGSDFQQSVWAGLRQIPYGTTTSYLQLAKNISHEKAVRAVANANGANAMAVIIPCHRVIGCNGKLVGYGGGLAKKKHLLSLEQKNTASLI